MSESRPAERIGLYGPWGYGNLGCAATVEAAIQNIRTYRPNAELVCFSLNPADTEERHGVPTYTIGTGGWNEELGPGELPSTRLAAWLLSRRSPVLQRAGRLVRRLRLELGMIPRTYRRLKPLDLLIVTGGGQLLDFWGSSSTHPFWLLKYAVLSKLTGTKLIFLSVGAGPLDARLSRLFCKAALRLSSYRSYRDEASRSFVRTKLNVRKDDPVYPDLAYSLRAEVRCKAESEQPVVGLGVMAYCDPRHWPEKDSAVYAEYLEKMASFADWLMDKHYRISLLVGESSADRLAVKDFNTVLRSRDGWKHKAALIKEETILTVPDLLQQIAQTDWVVASRLHNVLLATFLQKPVIALSYHPKIDALMEDAGQARYCLPIQRFDLQTLKDRFTDLQEHAGEITRHFAGMVPSHRLALEEQYGRVFQQF